MPKPGVGPGPSLGGGGESLVGAKFDEKVNKLRTNPFHLPDPTVLLWC